MITDPSTGRSGKNSVTNEQAIGRCVCTRQNTSFARYHLHGAIIPGLVQRLWKEDAALMANVHRRAHHQTRFPT